AARVFDDRPEGREFSGRRRSQLRVFAPDRKASPKAAPSHDLPSNEPYNLASLYDGGLCTAAKMLLLMSVQGHSRRSQHTQRWSGLLPIAAVPSAAANRRNGPEAELRPPLGEKVSRGAVFTPAARPAVRPPSNTRCRPRDSGDASAASSQCSSGAIP